VITARAAGVGRAPALVLAVVCAATARALIGGAAPAASVPAAVVFSTALLAAAVVAGARLTRVHWTGVVIGLGGGAALVALSLVGLPAVLLGARAAAPTLAWWVPLVTVVASAEELVFRGVLFDVVRSRAGDPVAIAVTALLFAAIHVPLYGAGALPIDLCVGVFLGCLRVGTGGVTAPLVAHVVADLATGFVG
jgi:membrane protease YdiL (CAAX protease family)